MYRILKSAPIEELRGRRRGAKRTRRRSARVSVASIERWFCLKSEPIPGCKNERKCNIFETNKWLSKMDPLGASRGNIFSDVELRVRCAGALLQSLRTRSGRHGSFYGARHSCANRRIPPLSSKKRHQRSNKTRFQKFCSWWSMSCTALS
jgi:hypothetical protein